MIGEKPACSPKNQIQDSKVIGLQHVVAQEKYSLFYHKSRRSITHEAYRYRHTIHPPPPPDQKDLRQSLQHRPV